MCKHILSKALKLVIKVDKYLNNEIANFVILFTWKKKLLHQIFEWKAFELYHQFTKTFYQGTRLNESSK